MTAEDSPEPPTVNGSEIAESSSGIGDAHEALERYRAKLGEIDAEHDALKSKDSTFGTWRVVLFFLALVAGMLWAFADIGNWVGVAGCVIFAVFFVVVVANEPVRDSMEQLMRFRAVVNRLVAQLQQN